MTKVEMLNPRGYCAGVKGAISIAIKAKQDFPDKNIYIVGYLVHNKEVIDYLNSIGLNTLFDPTGNYISAIENLPYNSIIIFPAHGHDEALDKVAKKHNIEMLDAVCPKVKQNNNIIKENIKNGHQVIYVGIANHPETNASISIDSNVLLFDINIPFDYQLVTDESPLIINQTTLNYEELETIHSQILKHIPNCRLQNEICNSTRMRQQRIRELPNDVDLIIIVGDVASSNTNRLLEVARSSHPNCESILVSNVGQIKEQQLQNKNHIIISSGASTPDETINMIYKRVSDYYSK